MMSSRNNIERAGWAESARTEAPTRCSEGWFVTGGRRLRSLALAALAFGVLTGTVEARFDWKKQFVPEEERRELAAEINAHFRAIRETGCPVNLEELNAFHIYPGEPGENAAHLYLRAFAKLDGTGKEAAYLIAETELPEPGERLTGEQLEAIAAFLDRNAEALILVEQAADLPWARFDIDLREGWGLLVPHIGQMRQIARLLNLRVVYAAETGDADEVLRSIRAMGSAANVIAREPIILSFLTSRAISGMQANALVYAVSRIELSSQQLIELDESLETSRSADGLQRALCGERAFGIASFRMLASDSSMAELLSLDGMSDRMTERVRSVAFYTWLRASGFWLKDFQFYLDSMRDGMAVAQLPQETRTQSQEWKKLTDREEELVEQPFIFSLMLSVSASRLIQSDLIAHTRTHAAQLALRAERWRAETGEYPESLEELVAEDEAHRATNLFSGEPFEYEVTPDGFRIDTGAERITPMVVRHGAD